MIWSIVSLPEFSGEHLTVEYVKDKISQTAEEIFLGSSRGEMLPADECLEVVGDTQGFIILGSHSGITKEERLKCARVGWSLWFGSFPTCKS